jgi:hypothetical protein
MTIQEATATTTFITNTKGMNTMSTPQSVRKSISPIGMSIRAPDCADFNVSSLKFDTSREDLDASFSAGPTRWSDNAEKPPTIAERKKSVSGRAQRWIDPTKLTDSTPQSARRRISAHDLEKAATAATDMAQAAMAQMNEQ